jgi:hypothetical protein
MLAAEVTWLDLPREPVAAFERHPEPISAELARRRRGRAPEGAGLVRDRSAFGRAFHICIDAGKLSLRRSPRR